MKVLNVHTRSVEHPISEVVALLSTLSKNNDQVWPIDHWPAMRFREGIQVGAHGGHGPIRYRVEHYDPRERIQFRFIRPVGFQGIHKLELKTLSPEQTQIQHTIDMRTTGLGAAQWILGIRALHNALIEDAFDRLENRLSGTQKRTPWSVWVKLLRKGLRAG